MKISDGWESLLWTYYEPSISAQHDPDVGVGIGGSVGAAESFSAVESYSCLGYLIQLDKCLVSMGMYHLQKTTVLLNYKILNLVCPHAEPQTIFYLHCHNKDY
jgi:hypothetical protein